MHPRRRPAFEQARTLRIAGIVAFAAFATNSTYAEPAPQSNGPEFPFYQSAATKIGRRESVLAGVTTNGADSGRTVAVLVDPAGQRYSVAIGMLIEALKLVGARSASGWSIDTPLGRAEIPTSDVESQDGVDFIDLDALGRRLGSRVRFDAGEFSVVVDTPWSNATPRAGASSLPPDVFAPSTSLSYWRSEFDYRHDPNGNSLDSATDLGGALGPGFWRLRYIENFDDQRRLENYGWVLPRGDWRFYFGHSRVGLGSLLPSFDLTGAQAAYSNRPDLAFGNTLAYGELVASRLLPLRDIRGEGPAGGRAELRVNGIVIAREPIRLDGSYEFRNVDLAGQSAAAEIVVYDRVDSATPVRVDQLREQASDLMLPAGTIIHYAGAGGDGNPLDDLRPIHHAAAFYQLRQGINDAVTVDATVQSDGGNAYAQAGAIARLGSTGVWAAHVARNDRSESAYELLVDGTYGAWFWHGAARHQDAGFFDGQTTASSFDPTLDPTAVFGTGARSDRNAEVGAIVSPRLQASIVAHSVHDPIGGDFSYVKPAFAWRPIDSVGLSARPDYRGDYAYSATWNPTRRTRLSATQFSGRRQYEGEQQVGNDYRVDLAHVDDRVLGNRNSLLLSRDPFGPHRALWSVGVLSGHGRTGYVIDGGLEILPGLSAHAQLLDDPLFDGAALSGTNQGRTFTLNLIADFAVTPSGLARGSFRPELYSIGGISGGLSEHLPERFRDGSLAGVGVLIDGQVRGTLDDNGRFYVGDLAPGVYAVTLDPERLPIELSATTPSRRVQVRAGATTRMDFAVEVRLGFAGRVVDAHGAPLVGRALRVRGADGQTLASGVSNEYGLFRFDGLAPGRYHVEALASRGVVATSRDVELGDRFLFGQDLTLSENAGGE